MQIERYRQPVIYGLIGLVNTAAHFVVFWGVVNIGASQAISNAVGFSAAVIISFILNARFTFRRIPTLKCFLRMYGSMLFVSWSFGWIGDTFDLLPVITFLIYCIINPIVGFLVTKYFVFR